LRANHLLIVLQEKFPLQGHVKEESIIVRQLLQTGHNEKYKFHFVSARMCESGKERQTCRIGEKTRRNNSRKVEI
jgi:hypothetical protein